MPEEHHERQHAFSVDGVRYVSSTPTVTGAYIIALIANFQPDYSLYEEGHGGNPDQLITDATTVSLEHGEHHFYTVPPATFGNR